MVSQFMHDPKVKHMQAVDRILQYLKAIPRRGLLFKRDQKCPWKSYTDADYASSIVDRRSTLVHCMFLGGLEE